MKKLILVVLAAPWIAFGTTVIDFPGPTTPTGVPCSAADPSCVLGGAPFAIYDVQLAAPMGGGTQWTLTIQTNYPVAIVGNTIPTVQWGVDGQFYSTSDFLIHWNGQDYGIVLAEHILAGSPVDSYVAGNLYQAPNIPFDIVLSGNPNSGGGPGVLPSSPRPNGPVWLAPGGNLLGAGVLTITAGGSGTPAQYTITDVFTAPAGFLASGDFQIEASSWVCFNGVIVGTGNFTTQIPEPGTLPLLVLILPAMGMWYFLERRRRKI